MSKKSKKSHVSDGIHFDIDISAMSLGAILNFQHQLSMEDRQEANIREDRHRADQNAQLQAENERLKAENNQLAEMTNSLRLRIEKLEKRETSGSQ